MLEHGIRDRGDEVCVGIRVQMRHGAKTRLRRVAAEFRKMEHADRDQTAVAMDFPFWETDAGGSAGIGDEKFRVEVVVIDDSPLIGLATLEELRESNQVRILCCHDSRFIFIMVKPVQMCFIALAVFRMLRKRIGK